ncbi:hypothetical protein IWW35_006735, partial [Coemansia sp. RSA 1878]
MYRIVLVSTLAALFAATNVLAQDVTVTGGAGEAAASSVPSADGSAEGGIGDASSE